MLKLSKKEKQMISDFIHQHEHVSAEEFETEANQLFLNREKTKNWTLVNEILSVIR